MLFNCSGRGKCVVVVVVCERCLLKSVVGGSDGGDADAVGVVIVVVEEIIVECWVSSLLVVKRGKVCSSGVVFVDGSVVT